MAITTETPNSIEWQGKKVPVHPMDTLNFSRLLSQEPAEVARLLKCCRTEGFFYLDLQGLDGRRLLEDQQQTLALMHRFFAQPLEAKNELGLISTELGYEPVGSRVGVLDNTRDGYEVIKISRDEIQRPNPRLPAALIATKTDLNTLEHTLASANIVTKTVLSAISTGLGLTGAARLENAHRNDRRSTTSLHLMHYIPADPATAANAGQQMHTDFSALTLLFSEQWGLQIRPPSAREFSFVAPKVGCAVVNVGDTLRFASGQTMHSCIHRVVPVDPDEHRYSIAYFLRAEDDAMYTDSDGRYMKAGEWFGEKFAAFMAPPDTQQAQALRSMIMGGHAVS